MPFGEQVWFKALRRTKQRTNKFESEWQEGIWLGHARASDETIIGTPEGVVRAWAVKRRSAEEQWNAEALKNVKGTPRQPNPNRPGSDIPIRVTFEDPNNAEPEPTEPLRKESARRMKLTDEVLVE